MINVECSVVYKEWLKEKHLIKRSFLVNLVKTIFRIIIGFKKYKNDYYLEIIFDSAKNNNSRKKKFKKQDELADVLTFSYDFSNNFKFFEAESNFVGNDYVLGEIYLGYENIINDSVKLNKSFNDHTTHLLVHGILHSIGYDHIICGKERLEMEELEKKVLKHLNIKNPYL
jgi:probable rRNA maturation factor